MNKQELISMYERISNFSENVNTKKVIVNLQQLDKPQAGHAEKAPCYLRNVIARLRELPLHDREVWLQAIMAEFEKDFCHSIWREGYEQGKFEGTWVGEQLKDADKIRRELNRPVVPQYIAEWIEYCKKCSATLHGSINPYSCYGHAMTNGFEGDVIEVLKWIRDNSEIYARAWLDGYEVEKEKRYLVKMKGMQKDCVALKKNKDGGYWYLSDTYPYGSTINIHTRKELEDAGFGWVFDCEGMEVEEVE